MVGEFIAASRARSKLYSMRLIVDKVVAIGRNAVLGTD